MNNIHATLISIKGKGVLLIGKSGCGKSDLALQFIESKLARLVADDRVILIKKNNALYGESPIEIRDKLEVRGIGILPYKSLKKVKILLCVELCTNRKDVERMPSDEFVNFLGISIIKIKLYPFDCSTIWKIIAKINHLTK